MTQPSGAPTPTMLRDRLYKQVQDQKKAYDILDAYYRGEPPRPPWLPEQAEREFRRILKLANANILGLVADSTAERMAVEGFRLGTSPLADERLWAIWQANNMDSASDMAILEALIGGMSYTLVAPGASPDDMPMIWVEHMSQTTLAYIPGTNRRVKLAGLKCWRDEWTGFEFATLYLPDAIYKWQSDKPRPEKTAVGEPNWVRRTVSGEPWPARNPLGEVPLTEIPNNPRLLCGGVSEIEDLIPIQERINKTLADRLITQDFGAFPQKWATGFPEEDENGQPNKVDIGQNRLIRSDIAETKFGQFEAAALDPYSSAKREDVKDAASRSRTPSQYLLGEMSNVNGETLKASESGLVSKVRQRMRPVGEGFEATMRLARRAAGDKGADASMETIWRNPEFRTEGELVDALVKMSTLRVPDEALWEKWGASQVEIERWKKMAAEAAAVDPIGQMTRALAQRPQPDQQPAPVGS